MDREAVTKIETEFITDDVDEANMIKGNGDGLYSIKEKNMMDDQLKGAALIAVELCKNIDGTAVESQFITDDDVRNERSEADGNGRCSIKEEVIIESKEGQCSIKKTVIEDTGGLCSIKEETMKEDSLKNTAHVAEHHKTTVVIKVEPEFITDDNIEKRATNLNGESDERCSIKIEGCLSEERTTRVWRSSQQCSGRGLTSDSSWKEDGREFQSNAGASDGNKKTETNTKTMVAATSLQETDATWLKDEDGKNDGRKYGSTDLFKMRSSLKERSKSCDECGKCFASFSKLKVHQRVHTGVRPYICGECSNSFTTAGHLKRHQRIHVGVKPYICDECGKSFTEASSLRRHKVLPMGVKPYTCDDCDKSFSRGSYLKLHQRIHTGKTPSICQECGKSFTESCHLKRHYRIHAGVKPYICDICSKSFAQANCLTDHQRLHTGEKPFSCEGCHQSFSSRSHLWYHRKSQKCPVEGKISRVS